MRAFIATGILGSFAFDADGKLLEHKLFPKKPDVISGKLAKTRSGEIIPEEREVLESLRKKGVKEIVWDKKEEAKGFTCITKKDNLGEETLRSSFRKLAMDLKWVFSQSELNEILSNVSVESTKKELKKEKRDVLVMRVVAVIDELDKDINVFSELLREWYGLHFPEMDKAIASHEKYVGLISDYGRREEMKDKNLAALAAKSSGMDLSEKDMAEIQKFSRALSGLYEEKKRMTRYIEEIANASMPNTSAVAGPILAARLLNLAGGLERMSKMTSSAIQLLGAEKALFRHLRGEGKAPKYGILFGHQLIQNAPREKKGKVARLVASKISLAARVDMFSGRNDGEKMKSELEKSVKSVCCG
jgi:nucleolar protein 56